MSDADPLRQHYNSVRQPWQMDISSLPFNNAVGIYVDGADVILTPRSEHLNHVNTIHATVVYGVAEAASGQCLLKRFPRIADSYIAVLRNSTVKYRRPASIGSDIRGMGLISDDTVAAFNDALHSRGRATIEIPVSLTQNDKVLFTGTFCWSAASK